MRDYRYKVMSVDGYTMFKANRIEDARAYLAEHEYASTIEDVEENEVVEEKEFRTRVVKLITGRDEYSRTEAMQQSITVRELIDILEDMPQDAKVIYSNDNGYTYGYVYGDRIVEASIKED